MRIAHWARDGINANAGSMKPLCAARLAAAAMLAAMTLAGCGSVPEKGAVSVTYYHRTVRCPACETIEAWAKTAVAPDVEAGRVTWRTVNLDEPANGHFVDQYSLSAQSVVFSEVKAGKEVRWKNIEKVWDLLDDEAAFHSYVKGELETFLAGPREAKL